MRFRPVTSDLALIVESHGPVLAWTSFEAGRAVAFSVALVPAELRAIAAILDTTEVWASPDGLLEVRARGGDEAVLVFKKSGGGLVPDVSRELVLDREGVEKLRLALSGDTAD